MRVLPIVLLAMLAGFGDAFGFSRAPHIGAARRVRRGLAQTLFDFLVGAVAYVRACSAPAVLRHPHAGIPSDDLAGEASQRRRRDRQRPRATTGRRPRRSWVSWSSRESPGSPSVSTDRKAPAEHVELWRRPSWRSLRRSGLLQFPAKPVRGPFLLERHVGPAHRGRRRRRRRPARRRGPGRAASRRAATESAAGIEPAVDGVAALAVEHLAGPQVALGHGDDVGPPTGRGCRWARPAARPTGPRRSAPAR